MFGMSGKGFTPEEQRLRQRAAEMLSRIYDDIGYEVPEDRRQLVIETLTYVLKEHTFHDDRSISDERFDRYTQMGTNMLIFMSS